jgi:hypothetical protein
MAIFPLLMCGTAFLIKESFSYMVFERRLKNEGMTSAKMLI